MSSVWALGSSWPQKEYELSVMHCFSRCSPLFSSFHSDTSLGMSFLLNLTADPCPQPLFPPLYCGATLQSWGAFLDFWCVSGGDPLCGCSICSVQASVESGAMAGNLVALQEIFLWLALGVWQYSWSSQVESRLSTGLSLVPFVFQPTNWAHLPCIRPQDWSTQSDSH